MLYFVKIFFRVNWFDYIIRLLLTTLINFQIFSFAYMARINPTWSLHVIPFIHGWISFANIFLKELCVYIHDRYWFIAFLCVWFIFRYWFWFMEIETSWNKLIKVIPIIFPIKLYVELLIFFKLLVGFSTEIIWAWIFLFEGVS